VEALAREKWPHLSWGGVFGDPPSSRKLRFVDRPAAGELERRLQRGDHVLLAKLILAFRDWSDFLLMTRAWSNRGITLHVLDPEIDSDTEKGQAVIQQIACFARMERERRAEQTREGLARRRKEGKVANQFCGYGSRLTGRRGHRRRVPYPEERRVMQAIASWHLNGYTWEEFYFHLLGHGVKTRRGTEWSLIRIRRAFVAELRLRAQEEGAKLGEPSQAYNRNVPP